MQLQRCECLLADVEGLSWTLHMWFDGEGSAGMVAERHA